MSEPRQRRHGLEPLLAELQAAASRQAATTVTVRGDLGHINLRGSASDGGFLQSVERALEQSLPLEPNTFSAGEHRVCWLGPDEWQVITPADGAVQLAGRLEQALSSMHASVNDLSGGQVALTLEGAGCRDLLARGCTLDLHPRAFEVGHCAQSGLARSGILLALLDDTPTFMIVVRRSFSDYLCRWLAHAGRGTGVVFADA